MLRSVRCLFGDNTIAENLSSHPSESSSDCLPGGTILDSRCISRKRITQITISASRIHTKREGTLLHKGTGRGAKRNAITSFSDASRRRFLEKAQECLDLCCLLTFTYPDAFPQDSSTIRKYWDALRRKLLRMKLAGVRMNEFQDRGAVHFHLLIDRMLTPDEQDILRCYWWDKVGGDARQTDQHCLDCKPIDDLPRMIGYLAKHQQKTPPAGWGATGRFWSVFGKPRTLPTVTIVGDPDNLNRLARVIRSEGYRAHARYRDHVRGMGHGKGAPLKWLPYGMRRKDRGRVSFSVYGLSQQFLARLDELLIFYHLRHRHQE